MTTAGALEELRTGSAMPVSSNGKNGRMQKSTNGMSMGGKELKLMQILGIPFR